MATRLRFQIPERCRFCEATGTVTPEQSIKGASVTLMWTCHQCGRDWPISPEEQQPERRRGLTERRRTLRGDRRKA